MLSSDASTPVLYDAAMHYAAFGYSVIPIYGDVSKNHSKTAATDWAYFQRQYATPDDFDRWFNLYHLGGLALVTGRLSRLLVLDFDEAAIHAEFAAAFPHLCTTYTVTSATRRLPHYYYRLAASTEIASRKIVGLDLLAEGRYVIAPPTRLNHQSYTVTQECTPYTLTLEEIPALLAFMEQHARQPGQNSVSRGTFAPGKTQISTRPGSSSTASAQQPVSARHEAAPTVSSSQQNSLPSVSSHSDALSLRAGHQQPVEPTPSLSSRLVSAASEALHTLRQVAHEIITDALPADAYGRVGEILLADADNPAYGHVGAVRLTAESDSSESVSRGTVSNVESTPITSTLPPPVAASARDTVSRGTVSLERLVQQYQQIAVQVGRNEALFRVAVRARDFGWTQHEVEQGLTPAHVQQPAPASHVAETARQRIQEARRTVASVFKRPPRPAHYAEAQTGLPVSVREALLALKQMPLLRVLDGLILKGIAAGARLTEKIVTTLLEGIIGRHSVLKALKAILPDGTAAFAPSPRTPSHTDVAAEVTLFPGQKMLFVGVTEPNKNQRGRPGQFYEMPGIPRLCQALGVRYTPSDPITAADLTSTRSTRQAIHRELLRRRPGLYSRALLARRLSVSVRSVQRYHRGAEVQVWPAYRQREIFWETLSFMPRKDDVPPYSTFLQDETGKRYPLDMALAKRLLTQRKRVFLMYQLPNHYSVPRGTLSQQTPPQTPREQAIGRIIAAQFTPAPQTQIAACSHNHQNAGRHENQSERSAFMPLTTSNSALENRHNASYLYHEQSNHERSSVVKVPQIAPAAVDAPQGLPVEAAWRYTPTVSSRVMGQPTISPVPADALLFTPKPIRPAVFVPQAERVYQQPMKSLDIEKAAQRLYDVLRRRCTEKTGYMTLAKARELIDQFGTGAVKRATHLLDMRRNVQNPAGFLISVLRSNAKLAGVLA